MIAKLNVAVAVAAAFLVVELSHGSQFVLGQESNSVLAAVKSGVDNEEEFKTVFDFVRSSDTEEKWRQIGWIPSLWSGLQIADEKQKPIFVWAMNGDPLGCV